MPVVLAILFLAVAILPQLWVRSAIRRHAVERQDLDGTGGELARHLLNRFDLPDVKVEVTEQGDHYDPAARAVRLSREHHEGRSLAAVAIAAHEVSHAIQHSRGERMLAWRQDLAVLSLWTDRFAGGFFIAAPILAAIVRTPLALLLMIAIGVALLAVRVVVDLVTLPVEFDASFGKALPILKAGGYVDDTHLPALRTVLRAAALTYVASALMSLVNLTRWVRLLR